jgi:hypothetical protein
MRAPLDLGAGFGVCLSTWRNVVIETWADLVRGLDEALAFALSLGIDPAAAGRCRFSAFRARLANLADVLERQGKGAAFEAFKADLELNLVALTESQELITLLPYLRSLPGEPVQKKLNIALQGPALPVEEGTNSNHPRNTMFELSLAARLYRAGIAVDIGGDADLAFTYNGLRWFGECKRPYKVETIERNLSEACCQLRERLSSSSLAVSGLLAISVSRPIATKAAYLEYTSEVELRRVLRVHVMAMVRLMEERMQDLDACRVVPGVGLLIGHLTIPAWNPEARMPSSVQETVGAGIDRRGDGERLWMAVEGTFSR